MKKKGRKVYRNLIIILIILIIVFIGLLFKNKFSEKNLENNTHEVTSTLEEQLQNDEAMMIETKYCDLYYPAKWEQNLRTEIIEDQTCMVRFYGSIEGKEEQHLFDIVFGGEDSIFAGTLEVSGEKLNVGFVFGELTVTDGWSAEDKDTIRAMQEDVNYVLGMLSKEDGFEN